MDPLAPSSLEIVFMVAAIVAVIFACYAIRQMSTHQWSVAAGLTLIVLTVLIPFAGPVLVAGLRARDRMRRPALS